MKLLSAAPLSASTDLRVGVGGGVLVATSSGISSGTSISIPVPAAAQDGDYAVLAGTTRNNVPSASGPDGGGWTEHLRDENATTGGEWNFVYSKRLSSEGANWTLSLSTSSSSTQNAVAAVVVFRGPTEVSGFGSYLPRDVFGEGVTTYQALYTPGVTAKSRGIVVCGWVHSFDSTAFAFTGDSAITVDVEEHYDNYSTDNTMVALAHYPVNVESLTNAGQLQVGSHHQPDATNYDTRFGAAFSLMLAR